MTRIPFFLHALLLVFILIAVDFTAVHGRAARISLFLPAAYMQFMQYILLLSAVHGRAAKISFFLPAAYMQFMQYILLRLLCCALAFAVKYTACAVNDMIRTARKSFFLPVACNSCSRFYCICCVVHRRLQ